MPVSITANASARYAQASLIKQNTAVTQGTLRLSSGQRVLSAADDAASMAIGTSLKVENAGLASAIQNTTSGTSMLQIADGALGQISELMTRLQTLAVQSSSGQYDDATRTLLDNEFQGLKQEIDRLSAATSFNGVKMLQGTKDFDQTLPATMATDGVTNVRLDPNIVTATSSFRYSYDSTTEKLTVTKVDGGVATSQTMNITALLDGSVGKGINLQGNQKIEVGFSQMGVTLTLGVPFDRHTNIDNSMVVNDGGAMTLATPTFAVASTNVDATKLDNISTLPGTGYSTATGILTLPITSSGAGGTVTLDGVPGISYRINGGTATASGAASDDLVAAATPVNIEVYADVTGGGTMLLGTVTLNSAAATAAGAGSLKLDVDGGLVTATEDPDEVAATHLTYKVGTGILAGEDTINVDIPAMTLKALKLTDLDITTQDGADAAISALALAQTTLNQGRATVGAQQLRLEAVAKNLGTISDNNEAARSSMIDVDVSKEITEITTNSAMMQASLAMLSRANQLPDILLSLLKN